MKHYVIIHRALGGYNVSYYRPFNRCAVAVTINKHQWEVVVCCNRHSTVLCVIGHTHQLVRWRQNRENMVKGCPPPDTCSRATIYRDQTSGREIVGRSTSKQQYFHLFSSASVVQGSFYNESTIVSAPDSEDRRHLRRFPTPLSLTLSGFDVYLMAREEASRKRMQSYSFPLDPEDGLIPSKYVDTSKTYNSPAAP